MIEITYLIRLGFSLLLGSLVGYEREQQDKPCGIRTILFITLGATLIVLTTFKLDVLKDLNNSFDAIRAIAYYLVAIGFVGGGIINRKAGQLEGVTTASLLLPMSIIGFLCGMGELILATVACLIIYLILKLKYVRIKIVNRKKKRKSRKKK